MESLLQEPLLASEDAEGNLIGNSEEGESSEDVANTNDDINDETDNNNNSNIDDNNDSNDKDIVINLCGKERLRVNHNVFLNLVLALTYGVSGSLWNGTAFAAYLKLLGHDKNGPLGDIEAVNGLASLITALPIGYMADKIGRSKIIAAGGILLLITSVLQIGVCQWVGTSIDSFTEEKQLTAMIAMGVIMALWGVGDGIVNGPASALYADSIPEGKRSLYYNYLFVFYMVASAVGPLVSIMLFQTLGDVWDLYHLRLIIYVGMSIEIFNSLLMMLFDDAKALDEPTSEEATRGETSDEGCNDGAGQQVEGEVQDAEVNDNAAVPDASSSTPRTGVMTRRWIPYIIFFQGLIMAIGSGMTIKFFPLFFKDEVGMSPSQVQVVYFILPFAMVVVSTFGEKLSNSCGFGRVQTTLLFSCMGISCLFGMVFFKSYLDNHPYVLVPIYVMRSSLMNGSYPLVESILMDFVPKEERARWKSLDSVASFGWCGSAALGGMIADRYDYTHTFLATAIVQSIGLAVWGLLLPLVPRKEGQDSLETEGENEVDS